MSTRLFHLLTVSALSICALGGGGGGGEDVKSSWKDDDGLEVKIIKTVNPDKCPIKSQPGDIVDQFYKLTDKDGKEIGSNFGQKPYTFTLGKSQVIAGMDRAMTGMCKGEKRKVVIPGKLGFGDKGRERDAIEADQTLYYTVQLVDLFRPVPGANWTDEDGLFIQVTHQIPDEKCRKSQTGDTIHQHYTLRLEDGSFVDSSFSRNTPFIFKLGAGQVIGYGDEGRSPNIPGKATLYFDIELHKLIKHDEL